MTVWSLRDRGEEGWLGVHLSGQVDRVRGHRATGVSGNWGLEGTVGQAGKREEKEGRGRG